MCARIHAWQRTYACSADKVSDLEFRFPMRICSGDLDCLSAIDRLIPTYFLDTCVPTSNSGCSIRSAFEGFSNLETKDFFASDERCEHGGSGIYAVHRIRKGYSDGPLCSP